MIRLFLFSAALMAAQFSFGEVVIGPWVPKFKGVDYSVSTNLPGNNAISARRQVVHALRIDLHDPDVRFFTTPRRPDYIAGEREIGALTVTDFQQTYGVQAAINANFFSEGSYYLPAGYPMDVYGLAISEGEIVSPQDSSRYAAALMFTSNNIPRMVFTNWPAQSTEGVYTAVAGNDPLVIAGVNVGRVRDVDPHTAFGLSQDRRYLYVIALDGRQSGYSEGSNDFETAAWMLRLGAYDAINVDGGGSTTLVLEDSTGAPLRMNRPSAVADSGRERTVGSHFGIFAKPLPGFINDVIAIAEDRHATIRFSTTAPAAAAVEYGTTPDLDQRMAISPGASTNYSIELINLLPDTAYYYRVTATTGEESFTSALFYFKTTNYVTTNAVFDLSKSWTFHTGSEPGAGWNQVSFDDSTWPSGPGLLWVDTRSTPNPAVQNRATEMPGDPATGFPYSSYYLRTMLPLAPMTSGSSLRFTGYIDDGAVFYLNGSLIYRMRMPEEFSFTTLASGFPCEGDATCLDEFVVPYSEISHLLSTNNVLAVQVHNYNARSADITFGLALDRIDPIARLTRIAIRAAGGAIVLAWDGSGVLQSASNPEGPWTEQESASTNPVTVTPGERQRFYRVRR